jgi:aspartate aminotransferase
MLTGGGLIIKKFNYSEVVTPHIVEQVSLGAIVQVRDHLLDQQAKDRKILRLESGDPSFDIPEHVCDAMEKTLRDRQTHYTASTGIPLLRQPIR